MSYTSCDDDHFTQKYYSDDSCQNEKSSVDGKLVSCYKYDNVPFWETVTCHNKDNKK